MKWKHPSCFAGGKKASQVLSEKERSTRQTALSWSDIPADGLH